ncbi:nuclear transport factor 2 family protein [Aliiglaciecola sp.]|nr:nuclear transport factor 2 family protein [Aliiglaciecola sp.]
MPHSILLKLVTFVSLAFFQSTSFAEESAEQFFAHYLDSYNAHDPVAASQHYHQEVMITGVGSTPRLLSNEQMKQFLAGFLASQKSNDIVSFEWASMNVFSLSDKVAIASNIASRSNSQGEFIENAAGTFIANRINNQWKIVSLNIHASENVIAQ